MLQSAHFDGPDARLTKAIEKRPFRLVKRLICGVLLSVVGGAVCLVSEPVSALPSDIHWSQIETQHFVIIYDSKHQNLGEQYAQYAEEAFQSVSAVFGLWPDKTVILLDDTTDLANGSATGIPYPLIQAYPVLPTSLDTISDYGDWGLELLTHEFTHILNFEPTTGWVRPFRYIFGSIVRPNILLPRWYAEGLAVDMETRLSSFGRLRSANYLAIIRAMVSDESLWKEDISRINETSIPDWPGGARPYLMGALLWDEMVRTKGISIVKDLNLAYSRRIPFFIDGPVKDRFGLNYQALLMQTYERAEAIVQKQTKLIETAGKLEEIKLEQRGFFSHSPIISPDGTKLAFIGKQHNVDSAVFILERQGPHQSFAPQEATKAASGGNGASINRASWIPGSKALVYDNVQDYKHHYMYSDLFRLDLAEKKSTQLTFGMRAREPVVASDGKSIIFVQITPGSSQLASVKIDGADLNVLYTPPSETRISRPEFYSPNIVIFSEKHNDGAEQLKVLRLKLLADGRRVADGAPKTALAEFKPAHYPHMTRQGLLFVSEKSGVANLYLADKQLKTARAVTNTTTQVMTGEIDPDTHDLIYSRLESFGPQIFRSPEKSWTTAAQAPPQIGPLIDAEWPPWSQPKVAVEKKSEDYSPWNYLLPRYWVPGANFTSYASYFSASTGASDPIGRHSYSLAGSFDTLTNKVSSFGQYTNQTTAIPITVSGYNLYQYIYSGGFVSQMTDVNALGSFYLTTRNKWQGAIGWDYADSNSLSYSLRRNGPTAQLLYSNLKQHGLEISPEQGQSMAVTYTHYLPSMSDIEYDLTTFSLAKYFSEWILPERHAIALFASGSIAPRLDNYLFGTSTIGGNYEILPGVRGYVMRGYFSGAFIGRDLLLGSAEYRFPLSYAYHGHSTLPFFIRRFHGDVFVDALTLDGLAYNYNTLQYDVQKLGFFYYGTGAEIKMDTTVAYSWPLQFIAGLYYGFDNNASPTHLIPYLGLGI